MKGKIVMLAAALAALAVGASTAAAAGPFRPAPCFIVVNPPGSYIYATIVCPAQPVSLP